MYPFLLKAFNARVTTNGGHMSSLSFAVLVLAVAVAAVGFATALRLGQIEQPCAADLLAKRLASSSGKNCARTSRSGCEAENYNRCCKAAEHDYPPIRDSRMQDQADQREQAPECNQQSVRRVQRIGKLLDFV